MKSINLGITRIVSPISLHRTSLIGGGIAVVLLIALHQVNLYIFFDFYGYVEKIKLADVLLLTAGGLKHWIAFALVPVSAFGMLLITRYDHNPNRIIRNNDCFAIWLDKLLKSCGLALFIALVTTISSLLFGALWTNGLIDFETSHSLFASNTNGETMTNPPFALVILAFFICCFLILFIANSLWTLIDLISNKKWVPMLCLLAIAFPNSFDIPHITAGAGVQTLAWINTNYQFWLFGKYYVFLIAVLLLIVIQTINLHLARRKDYISSA